MFGRTVRIVLIINRKIIGSDLWFPAKINGASVRMDVIDYEVEEINKIVERVINNAKIIVCMNSLVTCKKNNSILIFHGHSYLKTHTQTLDKICIDEMNKTKH